MSKILVTGGAGFIGSHLVDALVKHHDVVVWDNLTRFENMDTYSFNPKAQYEVLNICKEYRLISKCEHVFHLAAIPRLAHCDCNMTNALEVNYAGTVAMADHAVRMNAHFHHISSCVVAEPNLNEYSYSKAMAEAYIEYMKEQHKEHPWLSFNIARLGNVYGPRQYDTLVSKLVEKSWANKNVPILERAIEVHGNGKQTRDYIYVDDVVRGLLNIMQFNNVTCDFGHEVFTVNKLVKLFDCSPKYVSVPIPEMKKVKLDKKKTYNTIGWKPCITMQQYINETKVVEYG